MKRQDLRVRQPFGVTASQRRTIVVSMPLDQQNRSVALQLAEPSHWPLRTEKHAVLAQARTQHVDNLMAVLKEGLLQHQYGRVAEAASILVPLLVRPI